VYLNVDHHQEIFAVEGEARADGAAERPPELSREEIAELAKAGDVRAPFGGVICEVHVEAGAEVERGDPLVVLEAMKMQTPLLAEVHGRVREVHVKLGQEVRPGDRLVKVRAAE